MEKSNPLKESAMSSKSNRAQDYVTRCRGKKVVGVEDRQQRLPGFGQKALRRASVLMIGAGGLGSEILEGLVRKGVGRIAVCDGDEIEASNLNRQHFFEDQIGLNKAKSLAKNMKPHAVHGTRLEGYGLNFSNLVDSKLVDMSQFDLVIVGVDNTESRVEASEFFREQCPVIFSAVDHFAEAALVSIQEPGKACFGCLNPQGLQTGKLPCFTPAAKDPLKIAAGLVLYGVDSLLMPERKRSWNVQEIHLAGFKPSYAMWVNIDVDCSLCGRSEEHVNHALDNCLYK